MGGGGGGEVYHPNSLVLIQIAPHHKLLLVKDTGIYLAIVLLHYVQFGLNKAKPLE